MNEKALHKGIKLLQAAGFPGDRKFSKENFDIWEITLCDLSPELFMAAIVKCVQTLKYFPTIAEIREKAEEIQPADNPDIVL